MVFDFDACEYTDLIKTSIQALTFNDELNSIVDKYLDPVLVRATIFPETFTSNIKTSIVTAAEAKVNQAKAEVVTQLDSLSGNCVNRRLGEMEVGKDGSQRKLTGGLTFGNLATSIQTIEGVVSLPYLSIVLLLYFLFILDCTFDKISDCKRWAVPRSPRDFC